jgi:succinate dehydrogenase / fumarate reductase membrane anchor subunit
MRHVRIETPLARVRGLGAAKDGTEHWWMQRLTAVLLVPLGLWFVGSIWWLVMQGASHAAVVDWLQGPVAATLMILFAGATFYHLKLGLQVVIEDYVHHKPVKWTMLIALSLGCLMLGAACVYSVIAIALKG